MKKLGLFAVLAMFGCDADRVDLRIQFATPALESATSRLRLDVFEGDCPTDDAAAPMTSVEFFLDDIDPLDALSPGDYAIRGLAFAHRRDYPVCDPIAEGCRAFTAPRAQPVELLLSYSGRGGCEPVAELRPCAAGFEPRELGPDGPIVCEPWAEWQPRCYPGGPTDCASVGGPTPLGADGFPDPSAFALPPIFVREGASGDGSRTSPFGTLAEAFASTTDVVVVLAAGTYALAVDRIPPTVRVLIGAGAGLTVLEPEVGAMFSRVLLQGACPGGCPPIDLTSTSSATETCAMAMPASWSRIEGVTFSGLGVDVATGGAAQLRRVHIDGASTNETGIQVGAMAALVLDEVGIERTAMDGVRVALGGLFCATRLGVHGVGNFGMRANGAVVRIEAAAMRNTRVGVIADDDTKMELSASVLEVQENWMVEANDGARVIVQDLLLRRGTPCTVDCAAIRSVNRSTITAERVGIVGPSASGVELDGADLTAHHIVIRDATYAIATMEDSSITLTDFDFEPAECAFQTTIGGSTDLSRGRVRRLPGVVDRCGETTDMFVVDCPTLEGLTQCPEP